MAPPRRQAESSLVTCEGAQHRRLRRVLATAGTRLFYRLLLPRRVSNALWRSRLSPVNRRLAGAQARLDRFVADLLAERRPTRRAPSGRRGPGGTSLHAPGRFLAEGAGPAAAEGYLPFGYGRRNCIGSSFALTELVLVVASIAAAWRLRVVEPERVREHPTVTLRPRRSVEVVLEER